MNGEHIPSYRVRNIDISPGLVLSPMSGVTTSAFRRLIKELNPNAVGLLVSEFVSVEGMTRKSVRTLEMMKYREMERPYAVQIFGYDISRMCDAARIVEDSGADILDINCGCPAPKVVRKGGGCELMRQPEHLQKIFREVRRAIKIPLTMKMRSGWDSGTLNALEIGRMAENEGVEAIAIHGRTRAQLYRGDADWSFAAALAQELKIPVLGSGDVVDRASAIERLEKGVKGLYIGRGAISNPLIFSEIMTGVQPPYRSDPLLAVRILERYIDLLLEDFNEKAAIGKLKQLASQMARGHAWRKPLLVSLRLEEQRRILAQVRDGRWTEFGCCGSEEIGGISTEAAVA